MVTLRVEILTVWCCFIVLTGNVCGYQYIQHPSFGNLIKSVTLPNSATNSSGDPKMIYAIGGCVQFKGTRYEGTPYVDVRLYDSSTVRTILLYLPTESTDIQVTTQYKTTPLKFSKIDRLKTAEYGVYQWEGQTTTSYVRMRPAAHKQEFSICFMKVYDKTLEDYCDCGDICNRNADVVCKGVCKSRPDNCHRENIALNKPANLSTSHKGANASNAVNGVTGTTFSASGYNTDHTLWNCVHTAVTGDLSPEWTLNLKKSYKFKYVTIYRRSTGRERMKDVQIKVDNELCKTITLYDTQYERMDLACDKVMTGQFVKLSRNDKILNFCELQIWVCNSGYYGERCESLCSQHCKGRTPCDGIDGTCPGGCEPGWYTPMCSLECKAGCSEEGCDINSGDCYSCRANFAGDKCEDCDNNHYGDICTKECGHCLRKDRPCRRHNGFCNRDWTTGEYCEAGFQKEKCTDECSSGRYGIDCKEQCSSGCMEDDCDPATGHCSCRPGWKGSYPKCNKPCHEGTYGENCTGNCGQGCRSNCDKQTGHCRCKPGFQPPFCESECAHGYYGQNCSYPCGQGCTGGQCYHQTGQCSCAPGWDPANDRCKIECRDGYHGNCSTECGHCAKDLVTQDPVVKSTAFCDKVNGHCPADKCEEGYMPPVCTERLPQDERDEGEGGMSVAIPFVVIACLLLCILALIGFLVFRRRQRRAGAAASGSKHRKLHGEDGEGLQAHTNNDILFQPGTSRGNEEASCHIMSASRKDEELLLDMDDMEEAEMAEDERWSVYQSIKVTLDPVQRHLLDMLTDLDAVKDEFKDLPAGMTSPHAVGAKEENKAKNRFKKLVAYDHSRVSLSLLANEPDSDYINASYIRNLRDEQAYIATQGPLPVTVGDFWRLVWEENVTQIIMLTNLQEKDKMKCHQYWPEKNEQMNHMNYTIKSTDVQLRADFFIRSFLIINGKEKTSREVKQYHMVTWPDHGVPAALALVNLLRCVSAGTTADSGPLLVHCSAGVGRTGTYLALDMMMKQPNIQKDNMDVFKTVKRMREDRVIMVQNVDQYVFLHEVLLEAYTSRGSRYKAEDLTSIFPTPINSSTVNSRIDQEFVELGQMKNFLSKPKYTMAQMEENKAKNRDGSVLADDAHLVYLSVHVAGRNQYINAVSLSTFHQQRGMLLTQLPLSDTMVDLWRLVVGFDVTTIVSLGSKEEEKKKDYCHYWPRTEQTTTKAGPYVIKMTSSERLGDTLTSYKLTVERAGKGSWNVNLLHFNSWAGEVPDNTSDLLHLLGLMDTIQSKMESNPVIIQCRDGAKRSGLFAALTNIISRLTYDRQLDIYLTVRQVQHVRPQAVTSKTQYRFCYEVALDYSKSFDVYANS